MNDKLFSYQDLLRAMGRAGIKAVDSAKLLLELRNIAASRPTVNHITPHENER